MNCVTLASRPAPAAVLRPRYGMEIGPLIGGLGETIVKSKIRELGHVFEDEGAWNQALMERSNFEILLLAR